MGSASETANSKHASPEKTEININEDVLIEILLYLPPKSIFRFMSVSKRWRNILAHPFFLRRYSAAAARRRTSGGGRLLAFFQRTNQDLCNSLSIPIPGRNNTIKYVPRSFGDFINSSNGLILCGCGEKARRYYIVNPITRKYVLLLPPPGRDTSVTPIGIMCEESTTEFAPIYTVVQARLRHAYSKSLYIDTYSSTRGEWAPRPIELVATDYFYGGCINQSPYTVVANGVFHWRLSWWTIAVYDPKDCEKHLQRITALKHSGIDDVTVSCAMTRSGDGSLWFGIMGRKRMQFFVLPKGEEGGYKRKTTIGREEWVLMYDVSVYSVCEKVKNLIWKLKLVLESFVPPSSNLEDQNQKRGREL